MALAFNRLRCPDLDFLQLLLSQRMKFLEGAERGVLFVGKTQSQQRHVRIERQRVMQAIGVLRRGRSP